MRATRSHAAARSREERTCAFAASLSSRKAGQSARAAARAAVTPAATASAYPTCVSSGCDSCSAAPFSRTLGSGTPAARSGTGQPRRTALLAKLRRPAAATVRPAEVDNAAVTTSSRRAARGAASCLGGGEASLCGAQARESPRAALRCAARQALDAPASSAAPLRSNRRSPVLLRQLEVAAAVAAALSQSAAASQEACHLSWRHRCAFRSSSQRTRVSTQFYLAARAAAHACQRAAVQQSPSAVERSQQHAASATQRGWRDWQQQARERAICASASLIRRPRSCA